VLSALTLPLAIAGTRYARSYRLLDAGYAIPLGLGLGIAALITARAATRRDKQSLGRLGGTGAARLGRVVGILGICLALTALLSLGVYELLQYDASRN
jgi:hypothetical protein